MRREDGESIYIYFSLKVHGANSFRNTRHFNGDESFDPPPMDPVSIEESARVPTTKL